MDDDELLEAFEAGRIDNASFPHELHLRVAWLLLCRYPRDEALERLSAGIRGIGARAGRPHAYHETITRAWFELVAGVSDPADHPELRDRKLLGRYYSANVLESGRTCWIEPDLRPLGLPG